MDEERVKKLDDVEVLGVSDGENLLNYYERLLTLLDDLKDLKDLVQKQKGNTEFFKRSAKVDFKNFTLLDEMKHSKAQRSTVKTWASCKHLELILM
ncbi:hypothetical protein K3495_g15056 [Podosphaera aphanis]|nr:hypothetical protein K3495_g15056 [Podosphaera aphanis]